MAGFAIIKSNAKLVEFTLFMHRLSRCSVRFALDTDQYDMIPSSLANCAVSSIQTETSQILLESNITLRLGSLEFPYNGQSRLHRGFNRYKITQHCEGSIKLGGSNSLPIVKVAGDYLNEICTLTRLAIHSKLDPEQLKINS